VTGSAELFFRGEDVGWETQIFRDGDLAIARTFILRDLAVGGRRTSGIGWRAAVRSGETDDDSLKARREVATRRDYRHADRAGNIYRPVARIYQEDIYL
jgi:hypothetical protein